MDRNMKRGWQVAAATLLLSSALFAFESFQLSLSDALGPGPGFFPFWLGVLGGVLSLILLVQVTRGREGVGEGMLSFDHEGVRRVALVLAGLTGATALLEPLGFRLSMLLLIVYLLLILGARNWLVVSIFALAGSFGVFHLFFDLLKVPLPTGIFGI